MSITLLDFDLGLSVRTDQTSETVHKVANVAWARSRKPRADSCSNDHSMHLLDLARIHVQLIQNTITCTIFIQMVSHSLATLDCKAEAY
jgi:hypothetical protein